MIFYKAAGEEWRLWIPKAWGAAQRGLAVEMQLLEQTETSC